MTTATNKKSPYPSRSGSKSTCSKSEFISSSKDNPCPVCDRTKDGDCSMTADKGLVLCYTEGKNGSPAQSANGYYFNGKYSDSYHGANACAQYTSRPKQSSTRAQPFVKTKSPKEMTRAVQLSSMEVEVEVDYLGMKVLEGSETLEQAQVTLAAWCKENGHSNFSASRLLEAKVKAARKRQGTQSLSDESPRLLREYRKIDEQFGERLRYNTLKMKVELDGETFEATDAKLDFLVDHDLTIKGCREEVADCVVKIAKNQSYSPVVEYLTQVHQQHGDDTAILNGFAERYFGTTEPMHQVMLKRFLIAAVARAFAPGCKQDCVLILQGGQGSFKSTFLETLASECWFNDSTKSIANKDDVLRLHRFWILEWSELENIFKRSDISQVKSFLSSRTDDVRPPYGRSSIELQRPSVIVGSTNEVQFLADPTGNRRFWVVPISKSPDIAMLKAERDRIWAAAVALFRAGEGWHLTEEEGRAVDVLRARFESTDPWFDLIADYVEEFESITTGEIAEYAIELEKGKRNSGHERRIAAVLRQLGFERTDNQVSHKGKKKRVFKRALS